LAVDDSLASRQGREKEKKTQGREGEGKKKVVPNWTDLTEKEKPAMFQERKRNHSTLSGKRKRNDYCFSGAGLLGELKEEKGERDQSSSSIGREEEFLPTMGTKRFLDRVRLRGKKKIKSSPRRKREGEKGERRNGP